MNANELLKKSEDFHKKFREDNKEQLKKLDEDAKKLANETKENVKELLFKQKVILDKV